MCDSFCSQDPFCSEEINVLCEAEAPGHHYPGRELFPREKADNGGC